ncbi:MAG: hypothetical protein KDD47_10955 [Acidobacteria bacterium]|nr:hypothetical protein [Acidobacteriota bacterium]
MDDQDREHMQHTFETWNRETLLEELILRGEDFVPEAREMIQAELERRGVTPAAIERARKAYKEAMAQRKLPLEELVTVETFGDRISADGARDLLRRNGVESAVFGSDRLLFGPGLLSVGPDPVVLKVAEHDAERAQQILVDFAPAAEEDFEDDDFGDDTEV